MSKLTAAFVEAVYWFLIFLSPTIVAVIISAFIYFSNTDNYIIALAVLGIGVISGIFLAERIRRKYGCSNFMGRISE